MISIRYVYHMTHLIAFKQVNTTKLLRKKKESEASYYGYVWAGLCTPAGDTLIRFDAKEVDRAVREEDRRE